MAKTRYNRGESDDEVMTIGDVAQYLRLSEAKVYQLARSGAIPALRIGKAWRFQKDLLQEWVRKSAAANLAWDEGDSVQANPSGPVENNQ